MPPEEVRIDELRLRLANASADRAHGLARQIAERVGERLGADGWRRDLTRIDLRVRVDDGASDAQIISAVAARILEALR